MSCRLIKLENGHIAVVAKKASPEYAEELKDRVGPDEAAVEIPEAQLHQALHMIRFGHQDVEVK